MAEEKTKTPAPVKTVYALLEQNKNQINLTLPKHIDLDRFVRIAFSTFRKTPGLWKCDPYSFLSAVMEASQLGLEIDNILGHAYVVPFKGKVQLIPGYKGLIDLAIRSGHISYIYPFIVYENDEYDLKYGTSPHIDHVPAKPPRGQMIAAYAVAQFTDPSRLPIFEWKWAEDIEKVKKFALGNKKNIEDSPWTKWESQMWRKTAVRSLSNYLKLSPEFQRGVALGDMADMGMEQDLGAGIDGAMEGAMEFEEGENGSYEMKAEESEESNTKVKQFAINLKGELEKMGIENEGVVFETIATFLNQCAENAESGIEDIKIQAVDEWDGFWETLRPRIEKVTESEQDPFESMGTGEGEKEEEKGNGNKGEGVQEIDQKKAYDDMLMDAEITPEEAYQYLAYCSEQTKKTLDELKRNAIANPDAFRSGYLDWRDNPPAEQTEEDEKAEFRKQWINKKEPGYSTFVHKNATEIQKCKENWPDVYDEMVGKWNGMYKEPWPYHTEEDQEKASAAQFDKLANDRIENTPTDYDLSWDTLNEYLADAARSRKKSMTALKAWTIDNEKFKEVWASYFAFLRKKGK